MSVRKGKKSNKTNKNFHELFGTVELYLLRTAMLIVFVVELCKFVSAEVLSIVK
jgi:hypothetical protein